MCGQFAILGSLKAIKDYYNFLKNGSFVLDEDDFYNFESELLSNLPNEIVKPMNWVPIVTSDLTLRSHNFTFQDVIPSQIEGVGERSGKIKILPARWGLIPFWAKDEKVAYKTINARQETLAEKPSFKYAYHQRRCLIPFTGFYERDNKTIENKNFEDIFFQTSKKEKLLFFSNPNNNIKSFAGLYEIWGQEKLVTFTIVTCPANEEISKIHHRMPVILDEFEAYKWLTNIG
ncbi:MAG: SOS response-associated peptidase [Candidatus Cloacimonetes bacterium]|nr:SOS response-associated peptidase [Candidatus Cloacimonadota bacterium]